MNAPVLPHAPGGIAQATAIEMARAQAEVAAAMQLARTFPRVQAVSTQRMEEMCQHRELAIRAFYRYSRGQQITGATIQLARAIAGTWGNIQYGVTELERTASGSQMQAWAWDLETNVRPSTTFIVPHVRVAGKTHSDLTDPRDVYENNANMGARRLREMIFSVLPPWYVEKAKAACMATIANEDSETPMRERVARTLKAFAHLGVTDVQLTRKLGRNPDAWLPADLATLQVIHTSLKRGETHVEDEFEPDEGLTAEDISAARRPVAVAAGPSAVPAPRQPADDAAPAAPAPAADKAAAVAEAPAQPQEEAATERPAEAPAAQPPANRPTARQRGAKPSTKAQHGMWMGLMQRAGFPGQDAALLVVSRYADVPQVGSLSQLTTVQMSAAINRLKALEDEDETALHDGVDAALPPEGDPLWQAVDDARQEYEQAQAEAE